MLLVIDLRASSSDCDSESENEEHGEVLLTTIEPVESMFLGIWFLIEAILT